MRSPDPYPPIADPAGPGAKPLDQLGDEICELAAHLASATCRWLLLVAEFDARGGWAEWGVKSCAHWLSWRCSIGLVTARQHVRVARRLTELPRVRRAFAAGELSYCKVRAIARVATPETEESLVEMARHGTGAQIEKLIRGYAGVLEATAEAARTAHERRSLTYQHDGAGSMVITARVPVDEGALVLQALDHHLPAPGPDMAERRADALVEVARGALEESAEQAAAGAGRGGEPCELIVHVDAEALVAQESGARAEIEGGPPLAPETVRRLGCDAAVVAIVEREGTPLSVGRRRRTIPPAIRRALRSRDGDCCRFPGCTHRRYLHAHHITHWARGGETSLGNLVQLCSHHHRLVPEGGFQVERTASGECRFRRRDGTLIPPVGRTRARGASLEQRNERRGLRVDAQTCMPRSAGGGIDYGMAVEGLLAQRRPDD